MRRLAVEATGGTRTHSPYTEFAKNRTDKNLNDKSGMPLQWESGRLKLGKVKILKGKRA